MREVKRITYLVASGLDNTVPSSEERITRNMTSKRGTNNDVTNKGIAFADALVEDKMNIDITHVPLLPT